jgi:hypothetical protein
MLMPLLRLNRLIISRFDRCGRTLGRRAIGIFHPFVFANHPQKIVKYVFFLSPFHLYIPLSYRLFRNCDFGWCHIPNNRTSHLDLVLFLFLFPLLLAWKVKVANSLGHQQCMVASGLGRQWLRSPTVGKQRLRIRSGLIACVVIVLVSSSPTRLKKSRPSDFFLARKLVS